MSERSLRSIVAFAMRTRSVFIVNRRIARDWILLSFSLAIAWSGSHSFASKDLQTIESDVESIFIDSNETALVFLFVAVECPISNRYAPAVNALHERFASKDLAISAVYTDELFSEEEIQRHREDFGYRMPGLVDFQQALTKHCEAEVTPEAVVFVRQETDDYRMVYRGRIDDRYVDFGQSRRKPGREDLREILEIVSGGNASELEFRETRAVGCYISPN
ncbi:MAG: hypothetical protein CBD18_05060 [Opitutales bacterium TMED158]|nr:MAG: hypothetical protein CBD18_05060 [Opitutales bacterium TMED158]